MKTFESLFAGLFDDLLADEVGALVELVDGQGAFGAGLGLFGQFGEQGFKRLHVVQILFLRLLL